MSRFGYFSRRDAVVRIALMFQLYYFLVVEKCCFLSSCAGRGHLFVVLLPFRLGVFSRSCRGKRNSFCDKQCNYFSYVVLHIRPFHMYILCIFPICNREGEASLSTVAFCLVPVRVSSTNVNTLFVEIFQCFSRPSPEENPYIGHRS